MVVLPDFNQYESIFSRVNNDAVQGTSIHIYPQVHQGKTRLIVAGQGSASGTLEKLPLKQGLRALKMGYFEHKPIMPILMLGDLREFPEKSLPYLHLHTLNKAALEGLSDFEKSDIEKGAWAKLSRFC